MKEEFLALVEKVKATGIANALCNANTVDERVRAWTKFEKKNQDLFKEIASWSVEFYDEADDPLFNKGETIQNPLEIVICIYISDISGDNIFEDWEDLRAEIRNLGNGYTMDLADAMDETRISWIEITEPIEKDED